MFWDCSHCPELTDCWGYTNWYICVEWCAWLTLEILSFSVLIATAVQVHGESSWKTCGYYQVSLSGHSMKCEWACVCVCVMSNSCRMHDSLKDSPHLQWHHTPSQGSEAGTVYDSGHPPDGVWLVHHLLPFTVCRGQWPPLLHLQQLGHADWGFRPYPWHV